MGCCYMDECMQNCVHEWEVGKDLIGEYQGFLQIIKKNN